MVLPVVGEVDMLGGFQVLPLFPDLDKKFHRNAKSLSLGNTITQVREGLTQGYEQGWKPWR